MCAAVVTQAASLLDGLDVLVNNAGGSGKPIRKTTPKDWRRIIDTHLGGSFLWTQAAAPALQESRGSILSTADPAEPACDPGPPR